CCVVRIHNSAESIDDRPVNRPRQTSVIACANGTRRGGRGATRYCATTRTLESFDDIVESSLALCKLCKTRFRFLLISLRLYKTLLSLFLECGKTFGLARFLDAILLDATLQRNELSSLPDDLCAKLVDTPDNCAITLRKDVQVLVPRDEVAERFRGKKNLECKKRTTLVDHNEPSSKDCALDLNFVLSANKI